MTSPYRKTGITIDMRGIAISQNLRRMQIRIINYKRCWGIVNLHQITVAVHNAPHVLEVHALQSSEGQKVIGECIDD
jgi:hypothetical protein